MTTPTHPSARCSGCCHKPDDCKYGGLGSCENYCGDPKHDLTTPTPTSALEEARKIRLGVCICDTAYAGICPHAAIARALSEREERLKGFIKSNEMWFNEAKKAYGKAQSLEAQLREREREVAEVRMKYHDAMEVLSRWENIDKAEAIAQLADAKREVERLREALKKTEWMAEAGNWEEAGCPLCRESRNFGHSSNCELAALLTRRPAPTGEKG